VKPINEIENERNQNNAANQDQRGIHARL